MDVNPREVWRNNKTGVTYTVGAIVINHTNAFDGQLMVLYYDRNSQDTEYCVREISEFKEKFTFLH